jgi:hypothetical protein
MVLKESALGSMCGAQAPVLSKPLSSKRWTVREVDEDQVWLCQMLSE